MKKQMLLAAMSLAFLSAYGHAAPTDKAATEQLKPVAQQT